jgi:hypothetical protein
LSVQYSREGLEAAEETFSCMANLKFEAGSLAKHINVLKDFLAIGAVTPDTTFIRGLGVVLSGCNG